MAFERNRGVKGWVFMPAGLGDDTVPRKHHCRDCAVCQMCSDARCAVCLNRKACRRRRHGRKGKG